MDSNKREVVGMLHKEEEDIFALFYTLIFLLLFLYIKKPTAFLSNTAATLCSPEANNNEIQNFVQEVVLVFISCILTRELGSTNKQ